MRIVWIALWVLLLVLVGLCVYPGTAPYLHWRLAALYQIGARQETLYDYLKGEGTPKDRGRRRIEQLRKQFADDFEVNWAAAHAVAGLSPEKVRAELSALLPRFGHRPELYAGLLRNECREFRIGRPEEYRFLRDKRPVQPANRKSALQVLNWARRGEQLDASNGFFSGMRVLALLALRRDEEAIQALKEAARKPRWDDYTDEEAEALVRFRRLLTGRRVADTDIAISGSILFPHFAYQRAMARIMVALAAEREQKGKIREGLQIRLALAEYGGRIQSQSPWLIGALVGVAISRVASAFPMGVEATPPPQMSPAQQGEWRTQQFVRYLQARGFPREANWFQAEYKRADTVVNLTRNASDRFFNGLFQQMRGYYWLGTSLFFCLGLVLGLGVVLITLVVSMRSRLSFVSTLILALIALLAATCWFAFSSAAEMMWRLLEAERAAQVWLTETDSASAVQKSLSPLPRLLRWVLPFGGYVANLILLAVGLLWVVFSRRAAQGQGVQGLKQFVAVAFAALLLVVNLLMIAQVRAERRLEQVAAQMRRNEIRLLLQASGTKTSLPPFVPPPR